jgi:hypothetical protein
MLADKERSMSFFARRIAVYKKLLTLRSYRRRVTVTLLAFFGATASVGQLILWLIGVSGGVALTYTLIVLIPIGALLALRAALPSAEVLFQHPAVGSTLRLSVGNLFDASDVPIVITMNRYFDTSPPWASRNSLIGQLMDGPFAGISEEFRASILAQLKCETEQEQPLGEIVRINHTNIEYLLLAVADRSDETRSTVAVDEVWTSLSRLWRYARQNDLPALRIPVVGSGYARAHVGRIPMLIILLTSYLTSAMETPICDIEIVIHPSDADPDVLELAKSYCEILGYKGRDQRTFAEGDLRFLPGTVGESETAPAAPAESH